LRELQISGVRVVIGEAEELDFAVRDAILDVIRRKPDAVLMFPTGSTPEGVYAALVSHFRRRDPGRPEPSWAETRCLNMDEYWRLPPWDPQSYSWYMRTHLYEWLDVQPGNLYFPDAMAPTSEDACDTMERHIRELGGLDHCFLGIGVDGHIAFNEAGLPRSRTHVIDLAPSTIQANQRFFSSPDEVPTRALTAGIDTLLGAKQITLLAKGEGKDEAIRQTLTGEMGVHCPASFLREAADRSTIYLDAAAASQLPGEGS